MNSRELTELLSRVAADQALSDDDQASILEQIEQRPELRRLLTIDLEIDSLLVAAATFDRTADSFVAATMERLAETGVESVDATAPTNAAEPRIAPSPIAEPPRASETTHPLGPRSAEPPRTAESHIVPRGTPTSGTIPNRRRRAGGRTERLIALAAVIAILLGIGWLLRNELGWNRSPNRSTPIARQRLDRATPLPHRSLPDLPSEDPGFAYVTASRDAVWETPHEDGDRLSSGLVRLSSGEATIRFDKGTAARLVGPATLDLRDPDEVRLVHGKVSVAVPPQAIGFTVVTPVGRVVDLGTEFDVAVEASGTTETLVRSGKVIFRPQHGSEPPGRSIELTAEGMNRSVASIPEVDLAATTFLPVSTAVHGRRGTFFGVISAGGRTLEFDSPDEYLAYRDRVFGELVAAPADFERAWSEMVRAMAFGGGMTIDGGAGPNPVQGMGNFRSRSISVTVDGRSISITESSRDGIRVVIDEPIDGKRRETVVTATDPDDLATRSAEARALYDRYLGSGE